jgi:hypothetical protein
MKKIICFTALFIIILTSCEPEKEVLPDILTDNCELPNGHLKWSSGGSQTCANASLFGDQSIIMTINGISLTGETFTLELDDVTPGTYAMTTDTNHILHTDQLGMAWESTNAMPCTLLVLSNNTSTNLLEANFSGTLKSPLGLTKVINSGTVKVSYTE